MVKKQTFTNQIKNASCKHSMVNPIKKVLLKHPKNAFINQTIINGQYLKLNYYSKV